MPDTHTDTQRSWLSRTVLFLLFVFAGLGIFLPSMPYSAALADNFEFILRVCMIVVAVGIYFLLRSKERWSELATLFLVLGLAAFAMTLGWQYGSFLLNAFDGDLQTMRGIALAKAGSSAVILLPIFLLLPLFYQRGVDLYLGLTRKGLIGLVVGTVAFIGFGIATFDPAYSDPDARIQLQNMLPWILLFVFTNALMEEILFRGLFLSIATSLTGKHLSAVATALVFTGAHLSVTYTPDVPVFLAILAGLGLIWAYLIVWSRSVWGSVVFHAGADLVILGGILESMQII